MIPRIPGGAPLVGVIGEHGRATKLFFDRLPWKRRVFEPLEWQGARAIPRLQTDGSPCNALSAMAEVLSGGATPRLK